MDRLQQNWRTGPVKGCFDVSRKLYDGPFPPPLHLAIDSYIDRLRCDNGTTLQCLVVVHDLFVKYSHV